MPEILPPSFDFSFFGFDIFVIKRKNPNGIEEGDGLFPKSMVSPGGNTSHSVHSHKHW